MYAMESHYPDLGPLSQFTLSEFFDYVRMIPYRRDPRGTEITARPEILLGSFPALDCKKKAILCGAYLQANGIPHRFIACSQRADRKIHHVFTQAKIGDDWKNVDPTYAKYRLFEPKTLTKAEVLPRSAMKEDPMNIERMGAELLQMNGEPMGFSIGKTLRKARDASGAAARFTQSNIIRPATGAALTAARSQVGQGLISNALSMVPGGAVAKQFLTKQGGSGSKAAAPAARKPLPRFGTQRRGSPTGYTPPAPEAAAAAEPDHKMLYIGGGIAAAGILLAFIMSGNGKKGNG